MNLHQGNNDAGTERGDQPAAGYGPLDTDLAPHVRALVLEHDDRVTIFSLAEGSNDGTQIGKAILEAGSVTHAATVRRDHHAVDSWYTRDPLDGAARQLLCLSGEGGVLTVQAAQAEPVFAYAPSSWQEAHSTDTVTYLVSDDGTRSRDPFDI